MILRFTREPTKMKLFLGMLLLGTIALTSGQTVLSENAGASEQDPIGFRPFREAFRDLLHQVKLSQGLHDDAIQRLRAGEDVNLEEVNSRIDTIMSSLNREVIHYSQELSVMVPLYAALGSVKHSKDDGERRQLAFMNLGKAVWEAFSSDKATDIIETLLYLTLAGELYFVDLDASALE
ncbi:uncharacterized protein LOC135383363 [Ornithodoros turicata]|uniref:uncharacterized protein LOC135383363 n=1 Tax=Ornithodoros turicata TaxID=34597 RepID=UPI00313A4C83